MMAENGFRQLIYAPFVRLVQPLMMFLSFDFEVHLKSVLQCFSLVLGRQSALKFTPLKRPNWHPSN